MNLSTIRSEFSTSYAGSQLMALLQSYGRVLYLPDHAKTLTEYSIARSRVFGILSEGLIKGHLLVEDEEGSHDFGTPLPGQPPVTLRVFHSNLWARILLSHDIGCQSV